jgi:hypothetical protein
LSKMIAQTVSSTMKATLSRWCPMQQHLKPKTKPIDTTTRGPRTIIYPVCGADVSFFF